MSKTKLNRLQLINEFESAPDSTLFNQNTLAAILDCSTQPVMLKVGNGGVY